MRLPDDLKLQKAPRVEKRTKRKSEVGPVRMSVCLYSNEAADFMPSAAGGEALHGCIFTHEAYPSVTYNVLDRLARFLGRTAAQGNPANIGTLRASGVFLVLTKNTDPDQIGFVPYRPVFYVVGDVCNFLNWTRPRTRINEGVNHGRAAQVRCRFHFL